jgi:hypothetical protein
MQQSYPGYSARVQSGPDPNAVLTWQWNYIESSTGLHLHTGEAFLLKEDLTAVQKRAVLLHKLY